MTPAGTPADLVALWCVVVHDSAADCLRLLDDLRAQDDPGWALVVADNSDDPHEVAALRPLDDLTGGASGPLEPGVVRRLRVPNDGYLGSAATALERLGPHGAEFVVVSNADLRVDRRFVAELRRVRGDGQSGDVLAPAVLVAGRDATRGTARRPSARALRRSARLLGNPLTEPVYRALSALRARTVPRGPAPAEPVYAPHGSCMVFARGWGERGGHLRHPQFLFGEELFVGEQLRTSGGTARRVPALRVAHTPHGSVRGLSSRTRARLQAEAARFWSERL